MEDSRLRPFQCEGSTPRQVRPKAEGGIVEVVKIVKKPKKIYHESTKGRKHERRDREVLARLSKQSESTLRSDRREILSC